MCLNTSEIKTIGSYRGVVAGNFDHPIILSQLAHIVDLLALKTVVRLSNGPDYVVKVSLDTPTDELPITIKVFKRQSRLKDWFDRRNKSKAERSFNAAIFLQERGVGTPAPIAWLDRWENGQLLESYYLCVFEPAICFRDALADIYHNSRR